MDSKYTEFLKSKATVVKASGFDVPIEELNGNAFEWQKYIVKWALKKGKCALFEDCGLGKTLQQLMFSYEVHRHTGGNVLIAAPLAVVNQTVKEGEKFGISANPCREMSDIKDGINITNYEMLEHFEPSAFVGIVLDESSILKGLSSKTRQYITESYRNTPFKLACTATPSPNDFMELGNHAEFLGIMTRAEMLATFFVHDGGSTSSWRLKGHAQASFFEWVASWGCCMTKPSDLGFECDGYDLPELEIIEHTVKSNDIETDEGQMLLFAQTSQSLSERQRNRRNSIDERARKAAEIVNSYDGQSLVWCDLNDESRKCTEYISGAVEVKGADSDAHKISAMTGFSHGDVKVLVSKPSIAGWGMNWQNCSNMVFVGLSDSFEAYYQAIRRCYRFGQRSKVTVHIVISDGEGAVKQNIERKQANALKMTSELVKHTKDILAADIKSTVRNTESYFAHEEMLIPDWLRSETA